MTSRDAGETMTESKATISEHDCACTQCPTHGNQPDEKTSIEILIVPNAMMKKGSMSCPGCFEFHEDLPGTYFVVVNQQMQPFCESCADRMIDRAFYQSDKTAVDALMEMLKPSAKFIREMSERFDPFAAHQKYLAQLNESFQVDSKSKNHDPE